AFLAAVATAFDRRLWAKLAKAMQGGAAQAMSRLRKLRGGGTAATASATATATATTTTADPGDQRLSTALAATKSGAEQAGGAEGEAKRSKVSPESLDSQWQDWERLSAALDRFAAGLDARMDRLEEAVVERVAGRVQAAVAAGLAESAKQVGEAVVQRLSPRLPAPGAAGEAALQRQERLLADTAKAIEASLAAQ
ncbi:MAG: hypothetical protein AAFU61_17780, partial [Pseudomonadota bacterium]